MSTSRSRSKHAFPGGAASRSSPAPQSTNSRHSDPVCASCTESATSPERSTWTRRSFAVGWPGQTPTSSTAAAAGVGSRAWLRHGRRVLWPRTSRTSSPPGTSTGTACSSAARRSKDVSPPRTRCSARRRRVVHEIVPRRQFSPTPSTAASGSPRSRPRRPATTAPVGVARYEDMLRPVADGQPEGFCKLIVETARRQIIGAPRARRVLGRSDPDGRGLHGGRGCASRRSPSFSSPSPTFTEGVSQAAQMLVNQLGVRPLPQLWSSLSSTPSVLE